MALPIGETPVLNEKEWEKFVKLVNENLAKGINEEEYNKAYEDYKKVNFLTPEDFKSDN